MMPVVSCANCGKRHKATPKRLRRSQETPSLCWKCNRDLPEEYRCKGTLKRKERRCEQRALDNGYCGYHQDQFGGEEE
jgi:hypothetical protein